MNLLRLTAALVALFITLPSLARQHLTVGTTDTFEVMARFITELERPEQNSEVVQIEVSFTLTTLIKHIADDATFITARIDEAGYTSIEDIGHKRYALAYHTDESKQDPDLYIHLRNVEDLKGKTFEFTLPHSGEDPDLVQPISQILTASFDTKFLKQIINERLISRCIRWYYSLAADKPEQWSEMLPFYLRPDGFIHIEPSYTIGNPDDPVWDIDIKGSIHYEDMRDVDEFLRGLKELGLLEQNIRGHARWNDTQKRTEELTLEAHAILEPKEVDPLGLRIYRKHFTQEYHVKRLD
ncbi:MAG: hypothetical protein ACF8GE_08300 [Phycisphaerales bacterium JB043]